MQHCSLHTDLAHHALSVGQIVYTVHGQLQVKEQVLHYPLTKGVVMHQYRYQYWNQP